MIRIVDRADVGQALWQYVVAWAPILAAGDDGEISELQQAAAHDSEVVMENTLRLVMAETVSIPGVTLVPSLIPVCPQPTVQPA